jgi:hypothetical protein
MCVILNGKLHPLCWVHRETKKERSSTTVLRSYRKSCAGERACVETPLPEGAIVHADKFGIYLDN